MYIFTSVVVVVVLIVVGVGIVSFESIRNMCANIN